MKYVFIQQLNFLFPGHEIFQSFLILLQLTKKRFQRSRYEIPYSFLIKLSLDMKFIRFA